MKRLFLLWRSEDRIWGCSDLLQHLNRLYWLLPAAGLLALFALEPANFALLLLGAVDDLVLLPIFLHALVGFLSADVRASLGRGMRVARSDAAFSSVRHRLEADLSA